MRHTEEVINRYESSIDEFQGRLEAFLKAYGFDHDATIYSQEARS